MIKFITLLTKFVVAILITLLFASCRNDFDFGSSVKGNGNITTENRMITKDFKSIDVSSGIEVIIEQSNSKSVEVETDSNLQELISTTVENGVLVIRPNEDYDTNQSPKVTIKMPTIESIEATSGSEVSSTNTLKGENIIISTSSAAKIDVSLEYEDISLDASSGSEISASGKALKIKAEASSGSTIASEELLANDVIADASSGSEITVNPIVSLNAEASSGAEISYASHPKSIQRKTSSGGSIDEK